MNVSGVQRWWEEWQLRFLVLSSLTIQLFLLTRQVQSKFRFPAWFKACIRLVYISSEPVTINALATLLNRQRKLSQCNSVHGSRELELLWAPILLMHLGGLNIPSYNIEDNEQWGHHVMVAVTQLLVFIPGILKCIIKPWAARSARFSSLQVKASPSDNPDKNRPMTATIGEDLEGYLYCVKASVTEDEETRDMFRRKWYLFKESYRYIEELQIRELYNAVDEELYDLDTLLGYEEVKSHSKKLETLCRMLFADHIYSYRRRFENLISFWASDAKTMHSSLSSALFNIYSTVYAKRDKSYLPTWILKVALPISAICLFHITRNQAYSRQDLRVTLVLLYGTLVLELTSGLLDMWKSSWPDILPQHNIMDFLASSTRHPKLTGIAELLRSRDLLYQQWSPKPCRSSQHLTKLVYEHIKFGWTSYIMDISFEESYIKDIETYRAFNDMRGQLTLMRNRWASPIQWSLEMPFEESILIWHIATDFCFYDSRGTSQNICARQCREISNYMMHLLVANPDMLMVGIRKDLVTAVYDNLQRMLMLRYEVTPPGEGGLARHIFSKMSENRQQNWDRVTRSIIDGAVEVAWLLLREESHTEKQMWEVIQGVWMEMLCFSAGRCRAYLHAKSLGAGVEYLSYVWLLLSYAGMQTVPERLHRRQQFPELQNRPPSEDMDLVTEEENSALSSTGQDTDHAKEENAAASSTSQGEGNAPEIEIVVPS
ncbi:unnamed protein product [Urochloa decumbens]|uniref:DUF4220 domain-containing protein n=1 Tax=Urochloa decumbens TaxID=240449 RepID=A0ABC9D8B3_9POAL